MAGFRTRLHWDHLLRHSRFGNVPRYATTEQTIAAESASRIPLELVGLITPMPADGGPVPRELIGYEAHAIGHAALLLADRGVLLAGDMLSGALIRMLDSRRPGQVDAYATALDRHRGHHRMTTP